MLRTARERYDPIQLVGTCFSLVFLLVILTDPVTFLAACLLCTTWTAIVVNGIETVWTYGSFTIHRPEKLSMLVFGTCLVIACTGLVYSLVISIIITGMISYCSGFIPSTYETT